MLALTREILVRIFNLNKMKITKKQIKELHQSGDVSKLKEWFPSVFGEELEVGVWYKDKYSSYKGLICIQKYNGIDKGITAYGFSWISGEFKESNSKWCPTIPSKKDLIKATHQEIETALINEAKKRGFKDGVSYKNRYSSKGVIKEKCFVYNHKTNSLSQINNNGNNNVHFIFHNGTWATIIPTKQMTQEQIEKELGYKIEIV